MIGFKTGYRNKTGTKFNTGRRNNTGTRNITDVEFKFGYRYVSGKRNKAG